MKVLALRVAAFRRFSDGVAVEGFSSSVNLLSGPNELGKSTLYQALEAAFLLRHGTTGAQLDALRPRRGGEPLVEVDFESAGRSYRIRKQFGRGKGAILSDLASGQVLARAGDAEDQLAALSGAGADGPGRVGLVWVRQQRALQAPELDVDPISGKAKARGEASALMSLLNDEIVEAAGSGGAGSVADAVTEALGRYITAGREGAKKGGPYDLALKARADAAAALQRAREAAAASEARLERIDELARTLISLEDVGMRSAISEKIATLEMAIAQAASQRARRDVAAAEHTARDLEAKAARQDLAQAESASLRRLQLNTLLDGARALDTEAKALAAAINASAATPMRCSSLANALNLVRLHDTNLDKLATQVEITPQPGTEGAISVAGAPVLTTSRYAVPEALRIEIAGAGSIEVRSSGGTRARAILKERDDAEADIARLVAEIGASDAVAALARGEDRAKAVARLEELRQTLAEAAPQGVKSAEAELARLSGAHEADLAALRARLDGCTVAELASRHRLEQTTAEAVDDPRFRTLSSNLDDAKRDLARREVEARRLSEQLERQRGEQAGIDEDGRAGEVASAQGALERAEAEVSRIEADIAALKLLSRTLTQAIEGVRTRYLEPVAKALAPYMAEIFPDSALAFREGFSLEAFMRAGEREDFATLSDGTREQLSILVRMSFARLFAERGAPVPLVLDDPLVYSDDQRLAAMCRALEAAGGRHQVVVLTCRELAFAGLTGMRLHLTPWTGV